MAHAGAVRGRPEQRTDVTPTPARASGVYLVDEPHARVRRLSSPAPAPDACFDARREPTRAWRPPVPALHAVLHNPAQRVGHARPLGRSSTARPSAVTRTPVIEVEELQGRDAAYVALLELAIADDEWEQDELTRVYDSTRSGGRSRPKAPTDLLASMLEQLEEVEVELCDEWEDEPATCRYEGERNERSPQHRGSRPATGPLSLSSATASSRPSSVPPVAPPIAARRAEGGWRPTAPLPIAWRRWRPMPPAAAKWRS